MNEARLLDLLALTHAIIADGWTQGGYSRNASGQTVDFISPTARRYCLAGAVGLACITLGMESPGTLIPLLKEAAGIGPTYAMQSWNETYSLQGWNDERGRTKPEVLTLLTNAAGRVGKG